jgi:hypothetical protein
MEDNLYEITSQEEYAKAIEIIGAIDFFINVAYSEIQKTYNDEETIKYQNFINRLKEKRLGLFNLATIYEEKSKDDTIIESYICRQGDTLALISQAYYGNSDYGWYIYYHNDLTDLNLTSSQILEIPKISSQCNKVFLGDFFADIDLDLLERGLENV